MQKICSFCGKSFITKWSRSKYCNRECCSKDFHMRKDFAEKVSIGRKGKGLGQIPWNKGILCSEETKEKLRKTSKGKHYSLKSEIQKGQHISPQTEFKSGNIPSYKCGNGKRIYFDSPNQGRICFRSSYEFEYAKWLNSNNIDWYYETITLDLGNTTYTPDFFLPEYGKIVEIKGYLYEDSKNKLDLFIEILEYHQCIFEVLFKDDLLKIGCDV